jgi:hypothetical protein
MIYLFSIRGGNIRYVGDYFYDNNEIYIKEGDTVFCYENREFYPVQKDMIEIPYINHVEPFCFNKNTQFIDDEYDNILDSIIQKQIIITIINKL